MEDWVSISVEDDFGLIVRFNSDYEHDDRDPVVAIIFFGQMKYWSTYKLHYGFCFYFYLF